MILFGPIFNNDLDTLKNLIDTENINDKDKLGFSPLLFSIIHCRSEIAKYLIENGANVNDKNNANISALMMASCFDLLDIVELLIRKGANIFIKDNKGKTALNWGHEYFEVVRYLIEKGANFYEINLNNYDIIKWTNEWYNRHLFELVYNISEKYLIDEYVKKSVIKIMRNREQFYINLNEKRYYNVTIIHKI